MEGGLAAGRKSATLIGIATGAAETERGTVNCGRCSCIVSSSPRIRSYSQCCRKRQVSLALRHTPVQQREQEPIEGNHCTMEYRSVRIQIKQLQILPVTAEVEDGCLVGCGAANSRHDCRTLSSESGCQNAPISDSRPSSNRQ